MVTLLRRPGPALAPFVDLLWYVDEPLPPGHERKIPTGSTQLVVNLADDELRWYDDDTEAHRVGGAGVCGVVDRPVGIDTAEQRHTVGVALRPGGSDSLTGTPTEALDDPVVDLAEVWGRAGGVLRDELLTVFGPHGRLDRLESILVRRLARSVGPDHAMRAAASALGSGAPLQWVVDQAGLSTSTFTRRFRRTVGLTPKRFARVRRLQRVLRAAGGGPPTDVDWSVVAADHGYADQSHLIHNFREFTGTTPGAFRPRSAGEPNHLPVGD